MLPDAVVSIIELQLGSVIERSEAVSGGCIAYAARLHCSRDDFFAKWSSDEAARTFRAEAASLSALHTVKGSLVVPEPILVIDASNANPGILLMEWIESGSKDSDFWWLFGNGLAELHRHTIDRYGFGEDNFIGRIAQENTWEDTWGEFFRRHRLEPQVARARKQKCWKSSWNAPLDRLYARLDDILPGRVEASILHGDLWAGNYMVDTSGRPVLIDPASYYGHREADLAMTELFGGFDRRFYEAYREEWPLETGYEERREIYNLYHLINHLNHFGPSYSDSIDRSFKSIPF